MSTVVRITVTTADGSPLDLATAPRTVLPDGTIVYDVANGATFALSTLPEFGDGDVFVESIYVAQSFDAVVQATSGNLVGEVGAGLQAVVDLTQTPADLPLRNLLVPQGWKFGINAQTPANGLFIELRGYPISTDEWPDLQCCHAASPAVQATLIIDGGLLPEQPVQV
jgi:hypothetical protein